MERTRLRTVVPLAFMLFATSIAQTLANKPRAVVVVGSVNGWYNNNSAENTAEEAAQDYRDAGYEVQVIRNAAKAEAVEAITAAGTAAVTIIAHGDGKAEYCPGLKMADCNWLDPSDLEGASPDIQELVIHSCGQDLQAWRDVFPNCPNENFHAWKGNVRMFSIYWWQYFHTAAEAPNPTPQTNASLAPFRSRVVDGMVEQPFGVPTDPWFQMDEALTGAFGYQTLNIYGTDEYGLNPVKLLGLTVEDGHVTQYDYMGYESVYFDITIPYDVMFDALEGPPTILDGYANALVDVSIWHCTGASEQTLVDGMAAVFLGAGASTIPEPTSLLALGSGMIGLIGFGLRRRRV